MKAKILNASKISTIKSYDFMDMVKERPLAIVHHGQVLGMATIDCPTGKKVGKVMIYSDFSRNSKKDVARFIKSTTAIEIVCGYGHDREESFFLSK